MEEESQGSEVNVEQEARDQGWVPLEDWRGDPEKHVDAETFVKRGEEIAGLATAKARRLEERLDALESENKELRVLGTAQKEHYDRALANEQQQRQRLIQQLEAVQAKAISEGDGQTHLNTQKQLEALKAQQIAALQQQNAQLQQTQAVYAEEMQTWVKDNTWYTEDQELRLIADGMADRVRAEMPSAAPGVFLKELARRVKSLKKDHPAFTNPNRNAEGSVSSDTSEPETSTRRSGKRTWANLPSEDRKIAERLVKTHGISKEEYLKNYEWE